MTISLKKHFSKILEHLEEKDKPIPEENTNICKGCGEEKNKDNACTLSACKFYYHRQKMASIKDVELASIIKECRKSEEKVFNLLQAVGQHDFYSEKQMKVFIEDLEAEKHKFGKLTMTILKYIEITERKPYTRIELQEKQFIK